MYEARQFSSATRVWAKFPELPGVHASGRREVVGIDVLAPTVASEPLPWPVLVSLAQGRIAR